jgi:hypothetical protein
MGTVWNEEEARVWRFGPWSFELRDDELADIAYDGRPVLRSVRAVVRDRNWDTAALVVDRVRDSGATITLHVRSEELGSSFRGVVRAEARGSRLVVIADLETEYAFATNRTGLVVLHPPALAGAPLRVTHSDGRTEESAFPLAISPHQPVFDIAQLAWVHAGSEVAVTFTGDVFEMEDQRNWSDASYKTYSRPLGLPFPYDLHPGERVRQSVQIDVREVSEPAAAIDPDAVRLREGGPVFALALGAASAPDPAPPAGGPAPAEILVEADLRTPNWRAALARAAARGVPLDVRVIGTVDSDYGELADALAGFSDAPGVARVGVFEAALHVTDAAVLSALREALRSAKIDVPVVSGSRAHFTELNREWAPIIPHDADAVAFSTTPLFHSLGTPQLIEAVAMQRIIARQAVETAEDAPVHVGPVTLRPRHNDVATTPPPLPTRDDLAEGYGAEFGGAADARQSAPELSAWTIASAAALGVPGVTSIAFFEEWGPRGIRSSDGEDHPVTAAIGELVSLRAPEATLLWGDSPDGLVWAVGARRQTGDVVLVSNLDRRARTITVDIDGVRSAVVDLAAMSFSRIGLPQMSS